MNIERSAVLERGGADPIRVAQRGNGKFGIRLAWLDADLEPGFAELAMDAA